jgi:hypothetical protein
LKKTSLINVLSGLLGCWPDPILAYNAEAEVNQLQWSLGQPDWISIAFASKMQILRV